MRLIDANRLKSKITGYTKPHEFVEEIDKRPTVDAIPIEWLENWKRGKTSIEQVVADKIMMDYIHRD